MKQLTQEELRQIKTYKKWTNANMAKHCYLSTGAVDSWFRTDNPNKPGSSANGILLKIFKKIEKSI